MRKIIFIIVSFLTIISCGKKKSNLVPEPTAAILVSPANNEACITGITISNTENKITFNWTAGANTDSYLLTVTNLISKAQQTQSNTENTATFTLQQNTPYSWYVTSKSSKSAASTISLTWKFYNSGSGTSSYPPYPAEILNPLMGQFITPVNGKINLQWKGTDADNDIVNYDVYLGTSSNNVTAIKTLHTSTSLADLSVNANTTYYWKVISRDGKGNTSDSGLFEFKTN